MPPKRKAASSTKARGKKVKVEPEAPEDTFKSVKEALKAAPKDKAKCKAKIDATCEMSRDAAAEIYEDYDCMLNQTNIGNNNNKFYIIQLITSGKRFFNWNRWGRVGEVGQSKLTPFVGVSEAVKDFEKKFKDKTKNDWNKRDSFTPHPGKYTLIEVEGEEEAEVKIDTVDGVKKEVLPCTLDKPTQELINLIFSNDMFNNAMETMNLDIKKMPLGKLSKAQIAKGFEALEELAESLKKRTSKSKLEELSSKFYTIIPHNFGRMRPPVIDTLEIIAAKKEMLLVLADIELVQSLQAEKDKVKVEEIEAVPHPLDQNYLLLKCNLSLMAKASKTYKVIQKYLDETGQSGRKLQLLNVWEVDREKEDDRFQAHDNLDNRRLLWHGTNVAVVAAILKSGLRIMPHSGGRVGKGIYLASENSKSACYVRPSANNTGIMFLTEAALGKEFSIAKDDSSLEAAPEGYDSVVARGMTEPDPSKDTEIILDGRKVVVPQGKPIPQPKYKDSYFSQSEYLVYKESQCRIRYLLELKF